MRQDIAEKLAIYYRDSVPGYILDAGKTFLKVHAGADFTGYQDIKITLGDLARYYAHEASNITSGCRTIGGLTGVRSIRLQKSALSGLNTSILREYVKKPESMGLGQNFKGNVSQI